MDEHDNTAADTLKLSHFNNRLAATYLDDAISCRHMDFVPTPRGQRIYRLYKMPLLRYLLYLALALLFALALVEKPAPTGWLMPTWATMAIELTCVMVFMGRLFHQMMVCPKATVFWRDTKNVTNAAILILTIVDICIFVAMEETATAICALHICCPGDEAGFCVKCQ